MLSIAPIKNSAYYSNLASEDYYNNDKEPAGQWAGKAAESLGLSGAVGKADFAQLVSGHDATGKALVRIAGRDNHRAGQDLCFSAPKSVTLTRRLASPELAEKIHQAELAAVAKAVAYVESVAQTRTSPTDYQKIAGGVFAIYEHSTARAAEGQPPDPQDHYHCLMMSSAVCDDGKTRAIDFRSVYQNKVVAGAVFQAELANEMRLLGFGVEKDRWSFRIAGISPELERHFSKRGQQVKDAAPENATASQRSVAAKSSRTAKGELDRAGLDVYWRKEAVEKFGIDEKRIDAMTNSAMTLSGRSNDSILRNLTKRKPYLTERDLTKAAALDCINSGRSLCERVESLKSAKGLNRVNDRQYSYTPTERSFAQRTATTIKQTLGVAMVSGNLNGQGRAAPAAAGSGGMKGAGGTRYEMALAQEKEIELAIKLLDHLDPDFMAKLLKLSNALRQAGEQVVAAQVQATKKLVRESGGMEM